MNSLVERTIAAHGGIKRRNELQSVTAQLDGGGALWGLRGIPKCPGDQRDGWHAERMGLTWRRSVCRTST
jgi:hypothetical protein